MICSQQALVSSSPSQQQQDEPPVPNGEPKIPFQQQQDKHSIDKEVQKTQVGKKEVYFPKYLFIIDKN